MTKTIDEITEIVDRIESAQTDWVNQATEFEEMWALELWDSESDDERTYVTSPTPFNAVATARRMINTVSPSIECPALGFDATSDEAQAMKERWLKAMWQQVRREMGENIVSSAFWQSLVYGKGVMQALWVKDMLPSKLQKNRLPFIIRTLDPRLCGFERGPLYMNYAYYKPTMKNIDIRQQNPEYQFDEGDEDSEEEVIEFWWTDHESGDVWNAVCTGSDWIMEPMQTKYYSIPIVPTAGMYQPAEDEAQRYLGMLYPLKDTWETTSDIMTMVATSLLYHFLPPTPIVNQQGQAVNDEPLMPDEVRQFPPGTEFPQIRQIPNVGLADYALNQLGEDERESTFTGAANGAPLGSNQAGYSYSAAMAADESRIEEYRNNLQVCMSTINEIVLGMVDNMAGAKGVTLQGRSESDGGRYVVELTSETIGANYQNEVRLKPVMGRDEAATVAMARGMVQEGIISKRTMRDQYLTAELPDDEAQRVELERAMASEALAPVAALGTLEAYGANSEAAKNMVTILQSQVDSIMAQLQQQQAQLQQMQQGAAQGAMPQQNGGPPGPQPGPGGPSMTGGMLSPEQEGIPTARSTFPAGQGDRPTPDDVATLMGG